MAPGTSSLLLVLLSVTVAGGSGLGILSSMNVQFMVVDPAGRRTGYDSVTRAEFSEIPSSRYGVRLTGESGAEYEGGDADGRSRDFVAAFTSSDHLMDGPYTLRVFGERSGPFWLSISVYREPVSEDFNVWGKIRAGEMKIYHVTYHDDLSVPVTIDTVGSK